ncbi:MAG: response regulator, partial [Nitrosopumilales archaeon CG11_big_fil_rev_8_21_14_0_20_33_24]
MTSCIVVDDDRDIVNVFCDMLSMIEVNVLATASDGDQAVNMYKKYHPDIVFTDLNMPKYDGFYAIKK